MFKRPTILNGMVGGLVHVNPARQLIITIDTEEDNQWSLEKRLNPTLENIKAIPELQGICDNYNAKPTYLVTYPVAKNKQSRKILKAILRSGGCEIGSHLHNWTCPPFTKADQEAASLHCKLPYELERQKIKLLTETIKNSFGVRPVSFRAGRWGLGRSTVRIISKLGYKVDSSVLPYTDWSQIGGINFSAWNFMPRYLDGTKLLEVPPSVGFNIRSFKTGSYLIGLLGSPPFKMLKMRGALRMAGILKRLELNPEKYDFKQMKRLADMLESKNAPLFHIHFHSSSMIIDEYFPLVKKMKNNKLFINLNKILHYLIVEKKAKPVTLSEFTMPSV